MTYSGKNYNYDLLKFKQAEVRTGSFRILSRELRDPPDFLDREGAEFLLIVAAADIRRELGIELPTEDETVSSADIFRDLRLDRKKRPTASFFTGEWG